jgi:hypothetical protein
MLGYLAKVPQRGLDIQLSRPTGNLSRDDVASNRNIAELLGTSFLTPPGEGGRR